MSIVTSERHERITLLTLNRPEAMNALGAEGTARRSRGRATRSTPIPTTAASS
jgi:hypothetical protein